MSGYLQKPDTAFNAQVETSTNELGHTEYKLAGNVWGTYTIDAVTRSKHIAYGHTSPYYGRVVTPAKILPISRLKQIAADFVARHYPNYRPGLFVISAPSNAAETDCDSLCVRFESIAPSGAVLPASCLVNVEADTGRVINYDETCLPSTINATPRITKQQAIDIGAQWIADNVDNNPAAYALLNDNGRRLPIFANVETDALMAQALIYSIMYEADVVDIDARTGTVIKTDGYLSVKFRNREPRLPENQQERFCPVYARGGQQALLYGAIRVDQTVYIWNGYARQLGVKLRVENDQLILKKANQTLRLPLTGTRRGARAAWNRHGVIYLPLPALQRLYRELRWDGSGYSVTLNTDIAAQNGIESAGGL